MKTAHKLLIVDDEIDVALAFKLILEKHRFSVDLFHKPLAALANFKPGIYNLALLDVKMAEISGFELYKKMREIDSNIKVCFLTASESYIDDFKRLFPELDHKHFMLKPIENGLLVTRIQQLNNTT